MHDALDGSEDNGYDKSGKKINNNGGDTTDYLYEKGKIISSKKVSCITDDSSEISADYRAYGIKIHTEGTGVTWSFKDLALTVTVAKLAPAFYSSKYIAKPLFTNLGKFIKNYTPSLNQGAGFRIGISQAKIDGKLMTVFRATSGNNKDHYFNIILGKHGTIKY